MLFDAVPLGAYEAAPDAFVLTDSRGRVRMINEAAGSLLGCNPQDAVGRRCWGIVGLHTPNGAPLCRRSCPVRRRLATNETCVRQRALRPTQSGTQELEIFTMKVKSRGRSWGVLHMFVPLAADEARPEPLIPAPAPETHHR